MVRGNLRVQRDIEGSEGLSQGYGILMNTVYNFSNKIIYLTINPKEKLINHQMPSKVLFYAIYYYIYTGNLCLSSFTSPK